MESVESRPVCRLERFDVERERDPELRWLVAGKTGSLEETVEASTSDSRGIPITLAS